MENLMAGSSNKALSAAQIKKAAAIYAKSKAKKRWQSLTKRYGAEMAGKISAASKKLDVKKKTSSSRKSSSRKSSPKVSSQQKRAPTGGIFSVLSPQHSYSGEGTRANQIYSGIMEQTSSNYNRLARPLLVNEADVVQYGNLKNLVAKYPGATRVTLIQYLRTLRSQVPSLLTAMKYSNNDGAAVTERNQEKIADIQQMAKAILDVVADVLPTTYYGSGAASIQNPTPQGVWGLKMEGAELLFSSQKNGVNVETNATAITDGSYGTIGQAKELLEAIQIMIESQSGVVLAIQGGMPGQRTSVAGQLANRQVNQNIADYESARSSTAELVQRGQVATSLIQIWYDIENLKTQGILDNKNHARLLREWKSIRKQADALPSDSDIMDDLGGMGTGTRAGKERIREAKYNFAIVVERMKNLQSIINNAQQAKTWVEKLKNQDASVGYIKSILSEIVSTLKGMNQLSKGQVAAIMNYRGPASQSQMQAAGALATPAQYKQAKASLSMTEDALAAVRRTTNKQEAQTTLAYLFSNIDWKTGLGIAGTLASTASAVSYGKVAAEQAQGYKIATNGEHQYSQATAYLLANPMMVNTIPDKDMNSEKKRQVVFSIQSADSLVGKLATANDIIIPMNNDPKAIQDALPNSIKALSSLHAEARSKAAAQYLAELIGYENKFLGLISANMMTLDNSVQGMMKNQAKRLKEILSGIAYDRTMTNKDISAANGKLSLSAFIEGGYGSMQKVRYALLQSADLLLYPVFRGDTQYTNLTETQASQKRNRTFEIGSQTIGLLSQQQAGKRFLTKRPYQTPYGTTELMNWTPLQSFNLRNKYFYSLYPFRLSGRFQQLYNAQIADLTGIRQAKVASVSFAEIMNMVRGG